jgi:tetratricopeptide (TPR) repeat protein
VLPKEIADQIVDRTDGVPLFIEELTKTVVESGILTDAGDRYAVTGPVAPLAIPTSLHASLLARLDRLAPTREVAQIGAVLGRSFSHELICAVSAIPQPKLDEALEQLASAELIFRRGIPPDAEYTFKHALVQDAAYSTLLRSRRQQLHGRIATTMERQFPEIAEMQPEVLARHCTEAGLIRGVAYWLKAGQHAIARCAMTEAVAQLRKGLDLLSCAPDGAARQQQELDLQITLGHALMAAKGLAAPEPGEAFDRARQLCDKLNLLTQSGSVLIGQFMFRIVRGELERAEHHAEEIRHLGNSRNDVMWKCFGSILSGCISYWLGRFIDARAYLENSLPSWNPAYRAFASSPDDPYVQALIHLARTLMCLGYLDEARLRRNEALAEARRLSAYNLVFALGHAAYAVDSRSEGVTSAAAILQSANEIISVSSEQGFPLWIAIGKVMRGWCLSAMGQAAEGLLQLRQGMADCAATGCKVSRPLPTRAACGGLRDGGAAGRGARSARRGRRTHRGDPGALGGGRHAPAAWNAVCLHARTCRGGGQLSPRTRGSAAAKRQVLGTAWGPRPRPSLARPRQAHRSP